MRMITSETDLTVRSLRNPNYAGAMNYLRTIIENGKIIQELPEVPEERYNELLCASVTEIVRATHRRWRPTLARECIDLGARAGRVDRQWAYNGTTCARLGPGKISILFWLDNLLAASSASTISRTASNKG